LSVEFFVYTSVGCDSIDSQSLGRAVFRDCKCVQRFICARSCGEDRAAYLTLFVFSVLSPVLSCPVFLSCLVLSCLSVPPPNRSLIQSAGNARRTTWTLSLLCVCVCFVCLKRKRKTQNNVLVELLIAPWVSCGDEDRMLRGILFVSPSPQLLLNHSVSQEDSRH